jgi:FkbM family methyltransferase
VGIKGRIKTSLKTAALAAGFIRRVPTENARISEAIHLLRSANNASDWSRRFLSCAVKYLSYSRSQLMQDLFALSVLGEKRNGYFVEFGAGDGVTLSNSYMLETTFGWTGIVAEPSVRFAPKIHAHRRCVIDTRCVWSCSGEKLTFAEVRYFGELSTLTQFAKGDAHDRSSAIEYTVETVSLNDLLNQHGAPSEIDYFSIDTEGSELEILKAFDFNRWRFNVITVEHSYVPAKRNAIYELLTANGYTRVPTELAQWDDWYVRNAHVLGLEFLRPSSAQTASPGAQPSSPPKNRGAPVSSDLQRAGHAPSAHDYPYDAPLSAASTSTLHP